MTQIKQLISGDDFTGFYLLKELEVKLTNGGAPKDYFDIVLCDGSGQMAAKLWDVSATDKETFFPMGLVKVQGVVQTYREKLQIKIIRMRLATAEDGVKMTDFIRSAPIAPVDLIHTIQQTMNSIVDEDIRTIVSYCVSKVEDKLDHYPAAKMHHHAYFAGLAYHIVRMLEIGEFICGQRPFLNADLIKAGIILHDIAKPEEMIAQLGIVTDYSLQGKLIGHISLASNWITEAAIRCGIDLDSEKVLGLQHLVLSHHNLGEWGSPVQPQTAEAVALHHIDAMDAKLQMVEDALEATPETEPWTPFIRGLENKPIYRMKL
ncbi:3'-5' exoribonuclease YhaM family protein [Paenibacillus sp. NEAU-GSW1]|uniref:3'-5' exoribonuclease YhaM family protein n=1 Tax=Paenibacillus sp. NEAU-GSW1 TaxID=2682486 RepID=UPI0012E1FF1A|nr:HD domain-containing protein [Paenibacillus sp. NEAU-GSW1]MUT64393.1 HD domain-containing protein [Paenibacillus sp. NEAU-GSW1]